MTRRGPEPLPLDRYRDRIALDEPFRPAAPPAPPDQLGPLASAALRVLATDRAVARLGSTPDQVRAAAEGPSARAVLDDLLTVRDPGPLPEEAVPLLDALLGGERASRPLMDPSALLPLSSAAEETVFPPAAQVVLWRGDITALAVDAVVNAANARLLGCWQPGHACIDHAIHRAAGPRIRGDCHTITVLQGGPEPTGTAKVTRGYHLPAGFVLHTVGPVVPGSVTPDDERLLASAYRSCLDLASAIEPVRTVALCSISTGAFGYPKGRAAPVALGAVASWCQENPDRFDRIVFDVFSPADEATYLDAIRGWTVPATGTDS